MTLEAAPIRYTADPARWRPTLDALGASVVIDSPEWQTFQLGSGQLSLHRHDEVSTELWFHVDDLDQAVAALERAGCAVRVDDVGFGRALFATAPDGLRFGADVQPPGAERARDAELAVMPLWCTPDVEGAVGVLVALGARRRLTSESGVWADLVTDGGRVGVHLADATEAQLALEHDGDLAALLERLRSAGVDAIRIDEAYGATVQIADPDGGERIWINELQTDDYGYRREA